MAAGVLEVDVRTEKQR